MKVFYHDNTGLEYFPSVEEAKSYNEYDPDAKLYSILDQIEDYRKDGVFHIRLCYPEFTEYEFPCNEWKQSSNMATESNITGFEEIYLTFKKAGNSGSFGGLGISPKSFSNTLIDDLPFHSRFWFAVGAVYEYAGAMPGPAYHVVKKVEVYLAIRMSYMFESKISSIICRFILPKIF